MYLFIYLLLKPSYYFANKYYLLVSLFDSVILE